MSDLTLMQATGLTEEELTDVLINNPRAYMAVRGAVAEKHLEKIIDKMHKRNIIRRYRKSSGDNDKDFYIYKNSLEISIECKNVEVIKLTRNQDKINYIEFLIENKYLNEGEAETFKEITHRNGRELTSSISEFFNRLDTKYRHSGIPKYEYSSYLIKNKNTLEISDSDFIAQFDSNPLTIDFQRTRNSTDSSGNTRRNRFYEKGEIDIVAACLFSRTMEWTFLYAKATAFDEHNEFSDRYSNKLTICYPGWTSDLESLLQYGDT